MLKVNTITKAVVTAFQNDPEFSKFTIERSEFVNENPSVCPWIGIYRGGIDYDPETLGQGPDYWTGIMTLRLIVQAANFNSGQDAEDDLEGYVETVISKIIEDTTIRASVDMVNDIKVTYSYVAEEEETIYFQAAMIEMTLEVSTA